MLSTSIYPLLACLEFALFSKLVQAVNDQTFQSDIGDLHLPSPPSTTLSSFNATSNDASIECDGQKYGFKPDAEDCASALRQQMVGRTVVIFGQRGTPSAGKFVALPYRLMGGMWSCGWQSIQRLL